jgi:hypothetical protein
MCFVPIEHAYEITGQRWQRINTKGTTRMLGSLRAATQRIAGPLLEEILAQLDRYDATEHILREVARLKAAVPPFDRLPSGRIFIINVGANASCRLQSPLFEDGRFEFVPIPEGDSSPGNHFVTYGDLKQFNDPAQALIDLFPEVPVSPRERAHDDPEFLTLTYGDNIQLKTNLSQLREGDFLFFLARLVPWRDGRFHNRDATFGLIGCLQMAERLDRTGDALFNSPAFKQNAHVRRYAANPSGFQGFAVFKGSPSSRRFRYAVPFDRQFVESVPILKADGSRWSWGRTTELGVIGSNTRTVRMHIDPAKRDDTGRARRFWRHVYEQQRWET